MTGFLHLLYSHLLAGCAEPSQRVCLARMMAARGILGLPGTGWRF